MASAGSNAGMQSGMHGGSTPGMDPGTNPNAEMDPAMYGSGGDSQHGDPAAEMEARMAESMHAQSWWRPESGRESSRRKKWSRMMEENIAAQGSGWR